MNKKLWITNKGKVLKRVKRVKELERLQNILMQIKCDKEARLIYVNKKGK